MDDYGDQNRPEYGPKEGLVVVRVVIMTMIIMVKIDWGSSIAEMEAEAGQCREGEEVEHSTFIIILGCKRWKKCSSAIADQILNEMHSSERFRTSAEKKKKKKKREFNARRTAIAFRTNVILFLIRGLCNSNEQQGLNCWRRVVT